MKPRVLFILKFRDTYDTYGAYGSESSYSNNDGQGLSSGLLNSAKFVVQMLLDEGYDARLVQVVDNNAIDREVTLFKPDFVFIEALWVVPTKFDILQKLHPNVQWVVRMHSELPFIAQEGVAIDWICQYVQYQNVAIAANSHDSARDLRAIISAANPEWSDDMVHSKVLYLPNFYPFSKRNPRHHRPPEDIYVDVACFGAIRPLKNHLIQAEVAIEYANMMGKICRFHINAGRCEQGGNSVLKNLQSLFYHTGHQLVEHDWVDHDKFLQVLQTMDFGMQVSFNETFNIVAADMVVTGLPIVVSPEVTWAASWCQAEPTSSEDILLKTIKANDWRFKLALTVLNLRGLRHFCVQSKKHWLHYVCDEC